MSNPLPDHWEDQQHENNEETAKVEREKQEQARKQERKDADPKRR